MNGPSQNMRHGYGIHQTVVWFRRRPGGGPLTCIPTVAVIVGFPRKSVTIRIQAQLPNGQIVERTVDPTWIEPLRDGRLIQ